LIEKSLAEDEGLADNLKSLLATSWHVHARATLNAVEPKGEATMMCGKSRRAGFALLILALILVGCAKRPQLVQAQAPAPTGAAVTEPAAPVVSPQPSVSRAPEPPPTSPTPAVPTPAVPTPPPAKEFAEVVALQDIYFDFDRYDIRPDAVSTLAANVDWMKSNPGALILIEGHCDERGTNEYNLALGDRRAKSTMDALVAQGVAADRITIISYGEERPVCAEHTESCWSRNRRAHFLAKVR